MLSLLTVVFVFLKVRLIDSSYSQQHLCPAHRILGRTQNEATLTDGSRHTERFLRCTLLWICAVKTVLYLTGVTGDCL